MQPDARSRRPSGVLAWSVKQTTGTKVYVSHVLVVKCAIHTSVICAEFKIGF